MAFIFFPIFTHNTFTIIYFNERKLEFHNILHTCSTQLPLPGSPDLPHSLCTESPLHTDLKHSKLKFSPLLWSRTGSPSLLNPVRWFAIHIGIIKVTGIFLHSCHILIQASNFKRNQLISILIIKFLKKIKLPSDYKTHTVERETDKHLL